MSRTRIKFCGMMRPEDARQAALAGADAVGMIFHRAARRNISADRAREILAVLPPFVTPVGVFVNSPAAEILGIVREIGLRHVQLHGDETPELVAELRGLVVIKTVRVEPATIVERIHHWRTKIAELKLANLRGLLLETAGNDIGGRGIANDWATIVQHAQAGLFADLPIVAAGGLTPETVGRVVRDLHPWAVDVSSGVESEFGKKSIEKMAAFVEAVRKT